jgi:hypothetical protein
MTVPSSLQTRRGRAAAASGGHETIRFARMRSRPEAPVALLKLGRPSRVAADATRWLRTPVTVIFPWRLGGDVRGDRLVIGLAAG